MAIRGRLASGVLVLVLGFGGGTVMAAFEQAPAGAASVIDVNTPNDNATVTPGNCTPGSEVANQCTIRDGLAEAGALGDTTINLPDPNTIGGSGHIYQVLTSVGPLDVSDSGHTVTMTGTTGQGTTILQAQCSACAISSRVLNVETGTTAVVSGVTVEDGVQTGSSGDAGGGGGILNIGTLDLSDSTVTGNKATFGGGVYLKSGAATLTNVAIDTNTTTVNGGGGLYIVDGTNSITGGSISNNTVPSGNGGAGYMQNDTAGDSITISGVTIDGNTASHDAGGLYLENDASPGNAVTFTNDAFTNNTAGSDGGALYIENDGTGDTVSLSGGSISGNKASSDGGAAYVENDGTNTTVSFSSASISSNKASSDGGAAYVENDGTNTTVSFTSESIDANTSTGPGGGIYFENDGAPSTVNFTGGDVSENTALLNAGPTNYGGGLYFENQGDPSNTNITGLSVNGNVAYEGGGLYFGGGQNSIVQSTIDNNIGTEAGGGISFDTAQGGATSVTASTISGNTVGGLVGISAVLGDGGGILSQSCNAIALTNDTITGNRSTNGGGYFGTACAESPAVSTAFTFDTVAGNTATNGSTGAGNVQTIDDSTVTFGQTIIAGGTATGGANTNCSFTGPGSVTSKGYNLIDNTNNCGTAAATDIVGKDPQLGALANNGGPTETLLPADSAPEVGAIPDAACVATGIGTDQRGIARGAGAASSCTIGAVEVGQNFNGYRLVANEGGIFDFGLLFSGSLANNHLNAPIVGLANAPGPAAYLMVGGDGGVFALGGANFFGSLGGQKIPSPIAAIAAPPSETGYWLAAQNGKIYNFGSVPVLAALSLPPGAQIVGMASTTDGQGAWLTDQFGDVYAEGSAQYVGGLGGKHINAPIVGIAAAASGQGYVLAAADGGAFNYGSQGFFGSVPGSLKAGQKLNAPIVGIAVTHSGMGYWFVGADGGVFNYGDAPFLGSMGGVKLNGPVVGIQHLGSVTAPA